MGILYVVRTKQYIKASLEQYTITITVFQFTRKTIYTVHIAHIKAIGMSKFSITATVQKNACYTIQHNHIK